MCEVCKLRIGTIDTFIGSICVECDVRITELAELKLKTWKLYKGWNEPLSSDGV